MLGLETALSIVQQTMVDTGLLDWAGVAERMSYAPARIGRVADHGRPIEVGAPANVVLYDPAATRTIDAAESASLSPQHAVPGMELPGRVVATFLRGKATVLDGKLASDGASWCSRTDAPSTARRTAPRARRSARRSSTPA